jgi:hypothetical protein
MKKTLMETILSSISEVMETMFFLPVEFERESDLAGSGMSLEKEMACQLSFTGRPGPFNSGNNAIYRVMQ